MEHVAVDDVEPTGFGDDVECRKFSDCLGTTGVAINHYRVAPGEGLPSGLHAHGDQEEIFVVLDGEATFETLGPRRSEAEEVIVGSGEAVRFAPGEYQSGRNDADADLVVLALGAPRNSEDVRVPLACPECGHDYLRPEVVEDGPKTDEAGVVLACPDCGSANEPEGCPECGAEMQVALGEKAGTVVVCPECGTEAETPFGE